MRGMEREEHSNLASSPSTRRTQGPSTCSAARRLWRELAASPARDAELRQLRRNHLALRRRIDPLVDVHDAAVEADEERPPRGKRLIFVDNAVGLRHGFGGIAQQRIVDAQRLRKRLVRFRRIDAGGKMRDIEPPDFLATLTE